MLTLVLAMALCTADGERICSYIDATETLEVTSDQGCYAAADLANAYNRGQAEPARFLCVTPQRYAELSGKAAPDHRPRTSL